MNVRTQNSEYVTYHIHINNFHKAIQNCNQNPFREVLKSMFDKKIAKTMESLPRASRPIKQLESLKTFISNDHWKYAGNSWTNSDNTWFSANPINQIQDSYEFMKKCDQNDSKDPRCKVWRVLFPSNAAGITDIFDVKECFKDFLPCGRMIDLIWILDIQSKLFFSFLYFFSQKKLRDLRLLKVHSCRYSESKCRHWF